jgi:hypothetical protein
LLELPHAALDKESHPPLREDLEVALRQK